MENMEAQIEYIDTWLTEQECENCLRLSMGENIDTDITHEHLSEFARFLETYLKAVKYDLTPSTTIH